MEKKTRKKLEIPTDIIVWFYNEYLKHCNFGYGDIRKNVKIVWLSADKDYGIATKVGNSYWDSDTLSTKYSPSNNWGFKVMGETYKEGNVIGEIPDRLTNVKRDQLIDIIAGYIMIEEHKGK